MTKNLTYYFTNNFGGGGSNVSRVFNYINLIKDTDINILLNYYYLDTSFKKVPSFNFKELNLLKKQNESLIKFLSNYGRENIKRGNLSKKFIKIEGDFYPKVFLDSGAGNILKELGYKNLTEEKSIETIKDIEIFFKEAVPNFLSFAHKFKADIVVGLDYADKGTYKKKENQKKTYITAKQKLINDFSKQKELILETIKYVKKNNFYPKVFIPVHGKNVNDYLSYFEKILNLENKENFRFDGFAIGGIGRAKTIDICKILENLRKLDSSRDFHILGAAGIKKIINLILSGANSFDCHTPWRRSSDGEANFLVPLLDKKLNILDNNNAFEYKKIKTIDENYYCDCKICSNYKISEIKKFYSLKGEDNYFAKILLYFHWVFQYDRLLRKIQILDKENKIIHFVEEFPNDKLKESILNIYKEIKIYNNLS